jgi:hypothetical protein
MEQIFTAISCRRGAMAVSLLSFAIASAAFPVLGGAQVLMIRIHNASAASQQDIADLKKAANAIFEQAKVKIVWTDCASPVAHAPVLTACDENPTAASIALLVINDKARTGDHAIGWTTLGTYVGTVHYRRAEKMARASTLHLSCGQILGHTAAHEVGHLLLGSADHGLFGVMKSSYDSRDLLAMTQGRLYFTDNDAQRIRVRLRQASGVWPLR